MTCMSGLRFPGWNLNWVLDPDPDPDPDINENLK